MKREKGKRKEKNRPQCTAEKEARAFAMSGAWQQGWRKTAFQYEQQQRDRERGREKEKEREREQTKQRTRVKISTPLSLSSSFSLFFFLSAAINALPPPQGSVDAPPRHVARAACALFASHCVSLALRLPWCRGGGRSPGSGPAALCMCVCVYVYVGGGVRERGRGRGRGREGVRTGLAEGDCSLL